LEISQDFFHNKRSYEAFVWAMNKGKELQILQDQGALIFDADGLVTGKFTIKIDGVDSKIGLVEGNCTWGLVGCCWDGTSGKIYCTMREVKETFSKFKYVEPKHIKKVC